jgi:hypothetical protein
VGRSISYGWRILLRGGSWQPLDCVPYLFSHQAFSVWEKLTAALDIFTELNMPQERDAVRSETSRAKFQLDKSAQNWGCPFPCHRK